MKYPLVNSPLYRAIWDLEKFPCSNYNGKCEVDSPLPCAGSGSVEHCQADTSVLRDPDSRGVRDTSGRVTVWHARWRVSSRGLPELPWSQNYDVRRCQALSGSMPGPVQAPYDANDRGGGCRCRVVGCSRLRWQCSGPCVDDQCIRLRNPTYQAWFGDFTSPVQAPGSPT